MKSIQTVLAMCMIAFLTGCGALQPKPAVVTTRNIFIAPSAALTKDCAITAPPAKDAYLRASDDERRQLLEKYSIALLGDLKSCNGQWATFRAWVDAQQQIYAKDTPK